MSNPNGCPVVLVTGAAGSLGSATATAFLERGYCCALVDRSLDKLEEAFPEGTEGRFWLHACPDLADFDATQELVAQVVRRYGQLDAFVHTVGVYRGGSPVVETDRAAYELLFGVNVMATVSCARAVAGVMADARSGAIVNIASAAATRGIAGEGAYAASKAAVVRLTESLASEVGPAGVNVNAVLPGAMDTPRNREALGPAADLVAVGAVVDAIVFLATPAGRGVQGAALPVYGAELGSS